MIDINLDDIENIKFHTNQTPEQLRELEEMKLQIEDLVNKDPQNALSYCQNYYDKSLNFKSQVHFIECIYLKSVIYYFLGDIKDALFLCNYALKNKISNESIYKFEICLGAIQTFYGDFSKAIEAYNNALNINKDSYSSLIYNNIAAIYFKQKEYLLSIDYLNKALELSTGNSNLVIAILNNIGRAYIELNDLESAENLILKSFELLNETDSKTQEMNVLLNIGLLYYKQENYAESYIKLLDAYTKCKELDLKNNLYSATLFLAHACSKNNMQNQAATYYLETLSIVRDVDKRLYNSALKEYIDFLIEQGNAEQAIQYFIEFDKIKDEIIAEDKEKEISALTVKFQNTEQKLEIEKLNREKEFQQTLLSQAEEVKKSNEQLLLLNKILTDANHELMENKILRAQMNPHFIYNTLNSISSLIKTNRNEDADTYLQMFSLLTRQIFENNTKNLITLFDEIDFCLRYIALEKLRFENRFQFTYFIDNIIDINSYYIPAMLIQPILENAIKHGIFSLIQQKECAISLNITIKDQFLLFEISDNGIGMDLPNETIYHTDRESSLIIVNKRINIYNKQPIDQQSLCIRSNVPSGCIFSFQLKYKL